MQEQNAGEKEHPEYSDDNGSEKEKSIADLMEEGEKELRNYHRMLARELNESVDAAVKNFDEMMKITRVLRRRLPSLRKMTLAATKAAKRSGWFLERSQGRRPPSKRGEDILWEIQYRWQEFRFFLRHPRSYRLIES